TTEAAELVIRPSDGAIVVAGTTSGFDADSNFFQDLILARYRASDGGLDPSFGTGGEVLTDFGPGSRATGAGAAVQPAGETVATATVSSPFAGGAAAGFGLARYTPDGGLDSSFGAGGKVITNVPGPSSDVASGETIQADGKILVVGTASVFGPDGSIVQ